MNIQSCRNPNTIIFTKTVKHFGHFYIYWKIKAMGTYKKKKKNIRLGRQSHCWTDPLVLKWVFLKDPPLKKKDTIQFFRNTQTKLSGGRTQKTHLSPLNYQKKSKARRKKKQSLMWASYPETWYPTWSLLLPSTSIHHPPHPHRRCPRSFPRLADCKPPDWKSYLYVAWTQP